MEKRFEKLSTILGDKIKTAIDYEKIIENIKIPIEK